MANFVELVSSNVFLALGGGAFLCGVALFYLVMRRTMEHREKTEQTKA